MHWTNQTPNCFFWTHKLIYRYSITKQCIEAFLAHLRIFHFAVIFLLKDGINKGYKSTYFYRKNAIYFTFLR